MIVDSNSSIFALSSLLSASRSLFSVPCVILFASMTMIRDLCTTLQFLSFMHGPIYSTLVEQHILSSEIMNGTRIL